METLENYQMFCSLTKEKNKVVGVYEEQLGCFAYEGKSAGNIYISNIHISHFTHGNYVMVYNNSYVLKPEEVEFLFKDIGGK